MHFSTNSYARMHPAYRNVGRYNQVSKTRLRLTNRTFNFSKWKPNRKNEPDLFYGSFNSYYTIILVLHQLLPPELQRRNMRSPRTGSSQRGTPPSGGSQHYHNMYPPMCITPKTVLTRFISKSRMSRRMKRQKFLMGCTEHRMYSRLVYGTLADTCCGSVGFHLVVALVDCFLCVLNAYFSAV